MSTMQIFDLYEQSDACSFERETYKDKMYLTDYWWFKFRRHTINWSSVFEEYNKKKSRIRETPTLSACADSSTNTKKYRLFDTFLHKSHVTCHMAVSHVTRHLPPVTNANSHLSLTPAATDLPLLTPPLSTVDWFQIQKNPN